MPFKKLVLSMFVCVCVCVCVVLYYCVQERIINVALEEGRKYLCEGRAPLAIPTALQALKMLSDIHGKTDVRLTPAYLILAEAAIG